MLGQEPQDTGPDGIAAAVGVAVRVADDLGIRAQLVPAQHDPGGPAHQLFHQRDVGLDPLDRRLDQDRVMHRGQQAQAVPIGPDAGDPQNVGAGALYWKIGDGAGVELGNAGATRPAHRSPHHSGIERMRQPVVRPAPVHRE